MLNHFYNYFIIIKYFMYIRKYNHGDAISALVNFPT